MNQTYFVIFFSNQKEKDLAKIAFDHSRFNMKKSFQKPRITSVQYVRRRKSLNESVQQNPMELIEYPLDRAKSSADSNKFHVERIRKDSFDREMERSQLQRTNTFQSEEGSQRLSSSKSRKQINLRFPSVVFLILLINFEKFLCFEFRRSPFVKEIQMRDQRRNVVKSEILTKLRKRNGV